MSHIAIIGAGIGGLSCATKLAALGHQVEVFENASYVGGKCRTENIAGFVFDTGPSLFTLPAVFRDLFLKTGAPIEKVLNIKAVDPAFTYHFVDGITLKYPNASRSGVTREITDTFGPSAAREWSAMLDRGSAMWEVARQPFIESPLPSVKSLFKQRRIFQDTGVIAPHRTLRSLGRSIVHEPHLQMILDRYATYTGSDPRKAPAALLTIPYIEDTFGAWHIEGGVGLLSEALATRARERGAQIHLSKKVTRILTQNSRVTGIETDGGQQRQFDIVISNADASHTYGSLLVREPVVKRQWKRITKQKSSLAGFVILLGLSGRTPNLSHHTVLFPKNYDDEFDSIFGKNPRPVADPTIYICAPDDERMRPRPESESWFVLVNAPRHGDVDWSDPRIVNNYRDLIVDSIEGRGFEIRNRIEVCEVRTPANLSTAALAPGGAIYGTSGNSRLSALKRTSNASKIQGLYLVGGSVHPGGGLPMVGIGAGIVCQQIGPAQ